jgi:broad specificity phosphatase PhoE
MHRRVSYSLLSIWYITVACANGTSAVSAGAGGFSAAPQSSGGVTVVWQSAQGGSSPGAGSSNLGGSSNNSSAGVFQTASGGSSSLRTTSSGGNSTMPTSGVGGTQAATSAATGGKSTGGRSATGGAGTGGRTAAGGTGTGGRSAGGSGIGGSTASTLGSGGNANSGTTGSGGTASSGTSSGLTIYYVRHAEVVANTVDASQITAENADVITDLGQRQITALSTYLQGLGTKPDAVLVSPTPRTQKTIEPYLVAMGLKGEVWIELNEISDLPSTGAALPAAPKYYSYYKASLLSDNFTFRDPNATSYWQNDTYEAGLLMVTTAKNEIVTRYDRSGKTLIVVGHAVSGPQLIALLRGDDLTNGFQNTGASGIYLLNTGIMRLIQDPQTGLFKLDGRNINNPATK